MPRPPALKVTVFTDYICPFCYVGHLRLRQLRDEFDLRVNWCFVEIHPDSPTEGRPVSELGYTQAHWRALMTSLDRLLQEDGIQFGERLFSTNSRKALLLAEAAKGEGRELFYALHDAIFRAFFTEGLNIGDEEVLRGLGRTVGLPDGLPDRAWADPGNERRLQYHRRLAARAGVEGVPTVLIGAQRFPGVVSVARLRGAARTAVAPA